TRLVSAGSGSFAFVAYPSLFIANTCVDRSLATPPAYEGDRVICGFDTLTLYADASIAALGDVIWSTGEIGDSIQTTIEGNYYYSLVGVDGCSGPRSPTFEVIDEFFTPPSPPMEALLGQPFICQGGAVDIGISPSIAIRDDLLVSWNNGATGKRITVTEPGTYVALVIDTVTTCISEPTNAVVIMGSDAEAPSPPQVLPGTFLDTCARSIHLKVMPTLGLSYTYLDRRTPTEFQDSFLLAPGRFNDSTVAQFRVTAQSEDGCTSQATVGEVRFREPEPAPFIIYNDMRVELSSSTDGPIEWYLDDSLITTTMERNYTPEFSGVYTARKIGEECNSPFSNEILVELTSNTTSARDIKKYIKVYPNPTRGQLSISVSPDVSQDFDRVDLISMTGRVVSVGKIDLFGKLQFSVIDLPTGIYTVLVHRKDGAAAIATRVVCQR
ncbi:MAG: T9SS type A sorting domain-containing protein, partial [Bacteroidota bacterium]